MLVSIHYCLISHLITSEHTSMSKYSLPAYELTSNESLHRFIDSLIHTYNYWICTVVFGSQYEFLHVAGISGKQ